MDLSWQHPSLEVQHGEGETVLVLRIGNSHLICCSFAWLSSTSPTEAAFVSANKSCASSVRICRFSSTCRLDETESLADSRPLMFVARILIAPCSHAMKPLPEALSLRFLEHKMGRVFRSLAFGYGKPQRMKVQTVEQQFSLTEKNGYRRDVERVD
jgi:hypothetical protein